MKKRLLSLAIACFGLAYGSSAQVILSQNFSSGTFAPWTVATTGGGGGWAITTTATSTQLGTIPAHGSYAVVDEGALASGKFNNPTTMTSPSFSLAGVTSPYLSYNCYYFEAYLSSTGTHERGWVDFSTDGGSTWSTIDSIKYNGYPTTTFDNNWITKFIALSSTSANCKLKFTYKDNGGQIIGVAVDNIMVYGAASTDLGLNDVAPLAGSSASYYVSGGTATITGNVTNYSLTDLASYTVTYKVGSGAPVASPFGSVTHTSTGSFSIPTGVTVPSPGQFPIKVWITATGDNNHSNDTLNTTLVGVPFMPKKRVVFEEATGTWCGWCVRGIVYMDSLWRADSNDLAIVSVHNSDPMQSLNSSTMAYNTVIAGMVGGFPSMVIDRRYTDDPSGAFGDFANDKNLFGFANLGLTTTTSGTDVTAHIKLEPAITLTGDYRLELIVEEDKVTSGGGSTGTWLQHNYYAVGGAGHASPMKTLGYDFNNLPTDIPGVEFPFVARYTVPNDLTASQNGVSGSLPSFMHFGVEYTYDFTPVTIPTTWNASRLRYIVYLIDNNPSNPTYGTILNSTTSTSSPGYTFVTVSFVGVADVNGGIQEMKMFPNPASDLTHVQFNLAEPTNIGFTIYDMTGRVVMSGASEQMVAGAHQLNISTENLASGIYNVVVKSDKGSVSQRLSIAK